MPRHSERPEAAFMLARGAYIHYCSKNTMNENVTWLQLGMLGVGWGGVVMSSHAGGRGTERRRREGEVVGRCIGHCLRTGIGFALP